MSGSSTAGSEYRGAETEVDHGNTLRECVTINRATEEGEVTSIGNGNLLRPIATWATTVSWATTS